MSKVAIIYWSGTGNTQAMAELIAQGVSEAGGEADVIEVNDWDASIMPDYDAFAFGCPAMGDEELDEEEFAPVYYAAAPLTDNKKTVLFGSYDWHDGEWMDTWAGQATGTINLLTTVIAKDYPRGEAADACIDAGRQLAE